MKQTHRMVLWIAITAFLLAVGLPSPVAGNPPDRPAKQVHEKFSKWFKQHGPSDHKLKDSSFEAWKPALAKAVNDSAISHPDPLYTKVFGGTEPTYEQLHAFFVRFYVGQEDASLKADLTIIGRAWNAIKATGKANELIPSVMHNPTAKGYCEDCAMAMGDCWYCWPDPCPDCY